MEERSTDRGIEELKERMDERFDDVSAEFRRINKRFENVETDVREIRRGVESMQRNMLYGFMTLAGIVIGLQVF